MDVWGMNKRSWRKARGRAVSPIIATILLVAITVVLAAVLYVLISGLTHGPGNTPIGSAFAVGNPAGPTKCTGVNAPVQGCLANNDYVYALTIEQSTVTFASVLFEVKTSAGVVYSATTDGGFAFIGTGNTVVAAWSATAASVNLIVPGASSWTYTGISGSTPITTLYSVVVDMGSVNPAGQGYSFIALGTGSYSGTTSPVTLP